MFKQTCRFLQDLRSAVLLTGQYCLYLGPFAEKGIYTLGSDIAVDIYDETSKKKITNEYPIKDKVSSFWAKKVCAFH